MSNFPRTAESPLRPEYERFPWEPSSQRLKAWKRGQTGYPIVDAGMRQLWATGWMHNRVRMIVASFGEAFAARLAAWCEMVLGDAC